MTCEKGHIFCKKCIMENLLAQKKEIKSKKVKLPTNPRNITSKSKNTRNSKNS
jgi:hypothetical protein